MFDLYLITPELPPDRIAACARRALGAGAPGRIALQLRASHLSPDELRALGRELRAVTRERGAKLIVNGDAALARELQADGVQLKERGPGVAETRALLAPGALLGASRHDAAGVRAAALAGADFATLSPVFAAPDKGTPLGIDGFGAVARAHELPLFALGGVRAEHAAELVRAGAHGIAVIREVFDHPSPEAAVTALLAAIDAGRAAV